MAAVLVVSVAFTAVAKAVVGDVEGLDFTEAIFVFVVMAIAVTRPVTDTAEAVTKAAARFLPLERNRSYLFAALTVGPLLGSAIAEPAAMTVTAFFLKRRFFDEPFPLSAKYWMLAVLFVSVSIGGALILSAATPVLMVARPWRWELPFMLTHFGWNAALAVLANGMLVTVVLGRSLREPPADGSGAQAGAKSPFWLRLLPLAFLALVVITAHHPALFVAVSLFLLGVATMKYALVAGAVCGGGLTVIANAPNPAVAYLWGLP